ncbi:histone H3.v1-like [Anthonomus grandis grandis]|uniref:histone H3.v1-like n=1 Tax=Anthonomus grandis grandis TaxID=2921223 RepID=UPI0021654C38|nr:histone H3.v1-like [Anthonomus grandis grandis]
MEEADGLSSSDSGLSEETCWELFGGPCPEALKKGYKASEITEKETIVATEEDRVSKSASSKLNKAFTSAKEEEEEEEEGEEEEEEEKVEEENQVEKEENQLIQIKEEVNEDKKVEKEKREKNIEEKESNEIQELQAEVKEDTYKDDKSINSKVKSKTSIVKKESFIQESGSQRNPLPKSVSANMSVKPKKSTSSTAKSASSATQNKETSTIPVDEKPSITKETSRGSQTEPPKVPREKTLEKQPKPELKVNSSTNTADLQSYSQMLMVESYENRRNTIDRMSSPINILQPNSTGSSAISKQSKYKPSPSSTSISISSTSSESDVKPAKTTKCYCCASRHPRRNHLNQAPAVEQQRTCCVIGGCPNSIEKPMVSYPSTTAGKVKVKIFEESESEERLSCLKIRTVLDDSCKKSDKKCKCCNRITQTVDPRYSRKCEEFSVPSTVECFVPVVAAKKCYDHSSPRLATSLRRALSKRQESSGSEGSIACCSTKAVCNRRTSSSPKQVRCHFAFVE